MEKLLVISCVIDDPFCANVKYMLNEKLDTLKAGAAKLAAEKGASLVYLVPEYAAGYSYDADVKVGQIAMTGDNAYSCALQLKGDIPRPMIQDGYVAEYDGKEVLVATAYEAYEAAAGDATRFVTVNKDGKQEVKEVKVGTKLADFVDASGAKAVLVGGLKGKFVLPEQLSEEAAYPFFLYDSVTVYGKDACMVDTLAKIFDETWKHSCGKCVLCREGTLQFKTIVEEMTNGKAKATDVALITEVAELVKVGAYCPYGQNMPNVLTSCVALFPAEFEAHCKKKQCPAGVCYKADAVYVILPDKCTGCGDCVDECPYDAIEGKAKYIHMIDQDMCEACGKCVPACDEEAIIKIEDGKLPKLPKKLTKVGKF